MTSATLTQITAASGQDVPINGNFQAVSPAALYARRYGSGISGLVLGYYGGTFEGNDIADGTTTLAASQATIYVVAARSDGAVTSSTSNTNWNNTTDYLRLYIATTGASTITGLLDKRDAFAGGGGGGGGASAFTDLTDVPASYVGEAGKAVVVNATEDGLEFVPAAGTGTVTSVDASGGVETSSGSAITSTGTVRAATLVNAQTGTTYTYLTGDRGKLVTHSNGSAIAGTLPQATLTFGSGWFMRVKNKGAGTLTITPTTSTINGASTLALTTGQWALIVSDGANYEAVVYAPSGGGGSLTNFTEGVNTSPPNDTSPVVTLAATNAASTVGIVLIPKGGGALMLNIPDNSISGGNARGSRAVDLQQGRGSANQVASGADSFVVGTGNRASGTSSAAIGDSCTASGGYAQSLGQTNTASGLNSFNAGGFGCTASGANSISLAGAYLHNRGIAGAVNFGAAGWQVGKRQSEIYSLMAETSGATPVKVTSDSTGAVAAGNQIVLGTNSSLTIRGVITAIVSSGGDSKGWDFTAVIKRPSNAASTVLVANSVTAIGGDAGASTWAVALSADTTLGALAITVTGEAGRTIEWVVTGMAAFAQV